MGRIKEGLALARGIALGAGLMYMLDPVSGRRRRAIIRDKAVGAMYDAEEFLEGAAEDLGNRARGLAAETISTMRNAPVSDSALHDRVRAMMGRIVSHPRAVNVMVNGSRVTLSGPIFADEAPKLIDSVARMRGVQGVENLLETHTAPTDHPSLQGAAVANEPVPEYMQTYWTDGPRLLACIAGCALTFKGARHGGILGMAASLVGLTLMSEASVRTPRADQPRRENGRRRPQAIREDRTAQVEMDDTRERISAEAA